MYLVCVEGYSTAETAKLLSIPDATVRTRLSRARKLLRKLLEDQE
jgi:DNA-directed RNA polymerase specialized sigma24 family protein